MTNLLFGGRFLRGGSGPIVSSLCTMECFDVRQTLFLFLKEASRQKQMKQYSFYKRQSQREREKTTVSVCLYRPHNNHDEVRHGVAQIQYLVTNTAAASGGRIGRNYWKEVPAAD